MPVGVPASPAQIRPWGLLLLASLACGKVGYEPDASDGGGGDAPPAGCGDGVVGAGEECDDGNGSAADGCLPDCRFARCGDGNVRGGVEECDDGNRVSGDGCSSACLACEGIGNDTHTRDENGHCYSRHDIAATEPGARLACLEVAGHLVSYENVAENADAFDGLGRPESHWIGLYRSPAGWAWGTGEPSLFANWGPGEPTGEDCVFQVAGGAWADDDCAVRFGFVCEQDGWTLRPADNHAYRLFFDEVTFDVADARCRALGGHLATAPTIEEQVFLAGLATVEAWIGLADGAVPGVFEWLTGEPLGAAAWAPSQPNNTGMTRACGAAFDTVWYDNPCSDSFPYLCEVD